jgi:hypothetical protein
MSQYCYRYSGLHSTALTQVCELPFPFMTICFQMNHVSLHFRYFLICYTTATVNNVMKVKELRNFPRLLRERERERQRKKDSRWALGKPTIGVQADYVTRVTYCMLYRAFLCIPMGILLITPNQLMITVHIPAFNFDLQIPGYNVQRAYW